MSSAETFHHTATDASTCSCPIHQTRQRDPFTAPLGMRFAGDVDVRAIDQREAAAVYDSHHSYMDGDLHPSNLAHHGIYYNGNLMGAMTWRYGLYSKKRLHFDTDGNLLPAPRSEADFKKLPERHRQRARELFPVMSDDDIAYSTVVSGDEIVEANRICLGVQMPNLASAGLARSQVQFYESDACPDKVGYLMTFVRADYSGSMIRALRDKGWRPVSWREPSQASNREDKEIRDHWKWCFACPIEQIVTQCSILEWA